MRGILLRRLVLTGATLCLVSVLVFGLVELMPGDVGRTILGPYATREQVAIVNHQLGVDQPMISRYLSWTGRFLIGNWGKSYLSRQTVLSLVLDRFMNSVILAAFILFLVIPTSIGAGALAALRRYGPLDRTLLIIGISLVAVPEFVSGVFLLLPLAVEMHLFPTSASAPSQTSVVELWHELFLPALVGALGLFAYLMRMTRDGMTRALASDYVRTVALAGVPRRRVVLRHAVPNALLPIVTIIGAQLGALVGSLVIIETLFSYPGIGRLILTSATGHDVPVLEAAVLLVATVYLLANLCADLTYSILDPRIRRVVD